MRGSRSQPAQVTSFQQDSNWLCSSGQGHNSIEWLEKEGGEDEEEEKEEKEEKRKKTKDKNRVDLKKT